MLKPVSGSISASRHHVDIEIGPLCQRRAKRASGCLGDEHRARLERRLAQQALDNEPSFDDEEPALAEPVTVDEVAEVRQSRVRRVIHEYGWHAVNRSGFGGGVQGADSTPEPEPRTEPAPVNPRTPVRH